MKIFAKLSIIFALLLVAACTQAATLQANVDRNVIDAGDTLTLSLRMDDTGDDAPDLRALQKDFEILGQNSSSGIEASIGHMRRWTEWQITLSPLRSGTLTIPAFTLGNASSKPIAIQVKAAGTRGGGNGGPEEVFIETAVDRDSVYVQQQILLTVKIYTAIDFAQASFTDPEFEHAIVRKLAQQKSQKTINGVDYEVHELTYAIFPQQSGDLTIPEMVFTGTEQQRARSLFDFPRPSRIVHKLSKQLDVHVKPVPAQFTGKTWLPARNLTLQETWGGDPQHIAVGSSITRSIALQADGAMAAQLPALDSSQLASEQNDKAKLYADQPALDDQADGEGLHGKRTESAALIPAKAGALQLPEIEVHWWDVDSDSEKIATIPAQTLSIDAGTATNTATTNTPAAASNTIAPTTANPADTVVTAARHGGIDQRIWYAITVILAAGWIITLWLLWQTNRKLKSNKTSTTQPAREISNAESDLEIAIAASRQHQASTAHAALSRWVRQRYPATPTIAQWLMQMNAGDWAELLAAVRELERHNYGAASGDKAWNGDALAEELMRVKKMRGEKNPSISPLPSLYPTH